MRTKIDLYRRLARIGTESDLDDLHTELADRFGEVPPPVEQLIELGRLRIWAHQHLLEAIHLEGKYAVLTYSNRGPLSRLVGAAAARCGWLMHVTRSFVLGPDADDPDRVLSRLKSLLRPTELAS